MKTLQEPTTTLSQTDSKVSMNFPTSSKTCYNADIKNF